MNVLRYLISLALGVVLPLLVQRWDRRRLAPDQRAAAWNLASWAAALYAFGPFSMVGWVWVTRQRFRRWYESNVAVAIGMTLGLLAIGVVASLVVAVSIAGVDWCIGWLVSSPE